MKKIPQMLFRAFSSKIYAMDLVDNGKFQMGLIDHYTEIEDKKRIDQTEGKSNSLVKATIPNVTINTANGKILKIESKPGLLNVVGSHLNPLYLLCTSDENVDLNYLRKMGPFIVRINDPIAFLNDIDNAEPIGSKMKKTGKCIIEKVLYTKGLTESFDPDSMEAVKRSYIQKPRTYEKECEYRFIVTTKPLLSGTPDKYLYYDFNRKLDYLDLLR